jgi:hypothetical protein
LRKRGSAIAAAEGDDLEALEVGGHHHVGAAIG